MPESLKSIVSRSLDGFAERQRLRNFERRQGSLRSFLQHARAEGKLNTLAECQEFLCARGIPCRVSVQFGLTLITVKPGILFPFRPDGTLDWRSRSKLIKQLPEPAKQEGLFA